MEVIPLRNRIGSLKEAIIEAKSCIGLTPDVFIVKREIPNVATSYHYWVCRPIRNVRDMELREWIVEFPDSVEVISRREFVKYND